MLQIGEECYGPFKYIEYTVNENQEIGTKRKIKIVPDDDYVFKYSVTDLKPYVYEAQVTSNGSDPKRRFISNLDILMDKVKIIEKIEFIDDDALLQELQKVLSESKTLENINHNASSVLRDLRNLLEKHPEIQRNHSILTADRLDRVSELLSKVDNLDEYKQQIIEEYFKLGKVTESEKILFLQEHPEYLEDVIAKTTDYETRISKLQFNLQQETEKVDKMHLKKQELEKELPV